MSDTVVDTPVTDTGPVLRRLSVLDRWLPGWIVAAMAVGLLLGRLVPGLAEALDAVRVGSVSLPIAVGLLVMMYPVLAKVRYADTGAVLRDRRLMVASLAINWLLAPAFMFALAWLFLPDLPEYRTGLIIVGLARCIAMVLIWNELACGDREAAAVLVAVNSVFQVLAFGVLGWFYLQVLPGWLGLPTTTAGFSVAAITGSVLVFLGVPLAAGFLTRTIGEKARGRDWYEATVLPRIGPFALYGLLFTIVVLFALQGHTITDRPLDVVRIALPLLVYFAVVFTAGMLLGRVLRLGYPRTTTLAFTAAGNNFELAIAVAIATFGVTSGQALAGVVGPLIEVPALVGLVYVALWARRYFPVRHKKRGRPVTRVLFVCVKNGGKSQMAAGLFRQATSADPGRWQVESAGTKAGRTLNELSVEALAEVGVDLSDQQPRQLTPELQQAADVVVTVGEADVDPLPGSHYETWEIDEPSLRGVDGLERMRLVRDDIARHVDDLHRRLLADEG